MNIKISWRLAKRALYEHFARVGSALASPPRLLILELLAQMPRSVDDLAAEAGLPIANVSAHLKVLHAARLVDRTRQGQRVIYRLAGDDVFRLMRVMQTLGESQLAEADTLARQFVEAPEAFAPMTQAELKRRMAANDVLVLDVRPAAEYAAGHIAGARHVAPSDLRRRLAQLPRDKEIVAYCRGPYCVFSMDAVRLLRRLGFRARRLADGLPDWRVAGLPVATGMA